jgi:hypothetical protein
LLENIVKEGQPICERLEIKVTHTRTLESVRKLAIKVAARSDPFNKFEAPTGGNADYSKSVASSLEYERELEVTFFKEFEAKAIQKKRTVPTRPPPDQFTSPLVFKTHTEVAKILKPRKPNNLSPRSQVSILVIGEKDAGKTSFIWTLMRAYGGLFGYPTDSHNLRPELGMQIRVEVDLKQRAGRQDSEATIVDDDVAYLLRREGTTTDTVDIYKITETPYEPKIKTPGVTEKQITGELKMLDTEGLQLAGNTEGDIRKSEVKALVNKWTDAQLSLHPRLIPDATVLVFDGREILDQAQDESSIGFLFKQYRSLILNSRKALGTTYPVIVVLTRRDKVVEDVENKLKASGSLPVDEMALQRAIEEQIFRARDIVTRGLQGIEDVSVFFLQNYVEPSQDEIDRMTELQNEAALDEEAQRLFIREMNEWKQINESALESMHELLKKVNRKTFNEYIDKKTNEGPCKVQ